MTAQPPTTDQHAEAALEAHGYAMTALMADVHPYSPSAVRDREAELALHVEALRARAAAADNLADALRQIETLGTYPAKPWPDALTAEAKIARDALAAYDAAKETT